MVVIVGSGLWRLPVLMSLGLMALWATIACCIVDTDTWLNLSQDGSQKPDLLM